MRKVIHWIKPYGQIIWSWCINNTIIVVPLVLAILLGIWAWSSFETKDRVSKNEKDEETEETENVKVSNDEEKIYLHGPQWEKFYNLPAGETPVPIPYNLGIDFGEVEDPDVTLFFKKDGLWEKYVPNGKMQPAGEMNVFHIKVDKPTRVWIHFFYLKKNERYVRQKYLSKQY